jgi:uncharacterized delta-60 repeat protein
LSNLRHPNDNPDMTYPGAGRIATSADRNHPAVDVEPLEPRTLFAAAPPAGLDLSFGWGDGVIDVPLGYDAALSDAAVAPDGRIVVCGYTRPVDPNRTVSRDYFLARFFPDGTPDPTFGPAGTGVVVRDFTDFRPNNNDEASSLALMPDGKIVVGGTQGVVVYNGDGTPYDPTGAAAVPGAVAMYVPSGSSGTKLGWVSDVAAAPDAPGGAFYAVGKFDHYYVARRTPDGVLDWGDVSVQPGPLPVQGVPVSSRDADDVNVVVPLAGGGVMVAGDRRTGPTVRPPAVGMGLVRVSAAGFADTGFRNAATAAAGYALGNFLPARGIGGGAVGLAEQPDGKLVAAGIAIPSAAKLRLADGRPVRAPGSGAVWVARFNSDGTEDRSFGRRGSTYLRVGKIGVGTDVRVLPDGRILVGALSAASARDGFDNVYSHAVARLTANGRPDKSFGGGRGFGGRGRVPRGVLALPFAPPADRWGDDSSLGTHSPERALLTADADGNVFALAASNSTLHLARLSPAPPAARATLAERQSPPSPSPPPVRPPARPGATALLAEKEATAPLSPRSAP